MNININSLFNELEKYDEWVFDLDNTIFDQSIYDYRVFLKIEEYLSPYFVADGLADTLLKYKRNVGPHYKFLFNDVFKNFTIPESYITKALEIYRNADIYIDLEETILPDILMNRENRKLFLVTNGVFETQNNKILTLELDRYFDDCIVCSGDKLKPSRYAWDVLSKKFSMKNSVYVGDDIYIDKEFALNANIDFIYFDVRIL